MLITDRAKKNFIIFILLIIIAVMGYFLYKAYNNVDTKEETKPKNETTEKKEKIVDPVKESVEDTLAAKKAKAKSSTLNYIDAVEKQVMLSQIDTTAPIIKSGTYDVKGLNEIGVEVKGVGPNEDGVVTIDSKGAVSEAWLEFETIKVYYNLEKYYKTDNYGPEIVEEFENVNEITCTIEQNNNIADINCN